MLIEEPDMTERIRMFAKYASMAKIILVVTLTLLIISACNMPSPSQTAIPSLVPTIAPSATADILPTETKSAATDIPTVSPTINPTTSSTISPTPFVPDISNSIYLDDRSTATGLMMSFFNAINRMEYLRAYSYWRNPADSLGTFDDFSTGYQETKAVSITFGEIGGDAGAGQMYYNVPVVLNVTKTDNSAQRFAACYILHLGQPSVQATPPFQSLSIDRGDATEIPLDTEPSDSLATICSDLGLPVGMNLSPLPLTNHEDYSAENYLDERSDAVQVIRSYYNAINRHEFLRAYDYWKNPSDIFGTLEDFQNTYQTWQEINLVTGAVTTDAGAGNLYYQVPVVVRTSLDGVTQETYKGCFTLHLSQPGFQATPPFQPLDIRTGNLVSTDNAASLDDILSTLDCSP